LESYYTVACGGAVEQQFTPLAATWQTRRFSICDRLSLPERGKSEFIHNGMFDFWLNFDSVFTAILATGVIEIRQCQILIAATEPVSYRVSVPN